MLLVSNMNVNEKIENIINKLRPFLINDGGDIEFVKFDNGIVYVKMLGACANCHLMDQTLTEGIEASLINEIPEVTKVINLPQ